MRFSIRLVARTITLLTLLPATVVAQTGRQEGEVTWRVVVLNNADYLLRASSIMDQALRETITRESPRSVELFGESLDALRHPQGLDDALTALLKAKYDGRKVDLVMARTQASIDFVRRHRHELWTDTPVVFYNVLGDTLQARGRLENSTGVLIDIDPARAIELALRLHPEAREIVVVGGTAQYDIDWKKRLQPLLAQRSGGRKVTWLDDRPLAAILDAVGKLPPASVVLFTSLLIDAEGKTRNNPQVAARVAGAASVPVYGFLDAYVGTGVAGGTVADFAAQGRAAARLALQVLQGQSAATIPVQPPPPVSCYLDARAIARFGIEESRLPAECEVLFRTPSVWREYRWYIGGSIMAILLQSALIALLVLQRRQRRRAEAAAQQQRVELAHAQRLATVGEMTAAISHEINQPLGAILTNADAAEMLLDSDQAPGDDLRRILGDIRRDDLRASEIVQRIRALLKKHQVRIETIDFGDLVRDTVQTIRPEADRRRIAIEGDGAPGRLYVQADRIQLQQLLLNLIINAMDAMAQTPAALRRVTVHVSRVDHDKAEVAVSDYGHGIAVGTRQRLFDSFYTTKPDGLGLGLSIARTIAEAHGGSVRAENNTVAGATFRVTLPATPLPTCPKTIGDPAAQAKAQ